jgi:ADP-ribose pyrophosphatase
MSKPSELADQVADIELARPDTLAKGYRDYLRYRLTIAGADGKPVAQTRDILRSGKVVAVLPIDLDRDEIIMFKQFRLAAHLANGKGELVEIVAGRVDEGEALLDAARRECGEEIGVTPGKLVEIATYLTTPGLTDEEVTVYATAIDAAKVREGAHTSPDGELLQIFRVPIDVALVALERGTMRGSPVIIALQWLALNRARLPELLG